MLEEQRRSPAEPRPLSAALYDVTQGWRIKLMALLSRGMRSTYSTNLAPGQGKENCWAGKSKEYIEKYTFLGQHQIRVSAVNAL